MASERQPARSTTGRGFTVYDKFTDRYRRIVRVQQSSLATEAACWIFCEDREESGEPSSPHLTVEQAGWLRDALDTFIREQDQGEVPDGQ